MNDRRVGLAVTLTAVLGTPIAAGANEQPERTDSPQESEQSQITASNQAKQEMVAATAQTPPTVEPAAAIEFSTTPVRPLRVISGPPNFLSQRRLRPAARAIAPVTVKDSSPPNNLAASPSAVVFSTTTTAPAPPAALSPTFRVPVALIIEGRPSIEFSTPSRPMPAAIPLAQPVVAQTAPVVIPDTEPQSLQEQLSTLEQRQRQLEQEIEQLKQNLAGTKNATPAFSIAEDRPSNFTVSATGVFFKPRNSNPFDYAVEDAGNALALNGNLQRAEYDRGAGIRVGLSYQPPNSALDLAVAYTSLVTSGNDQAIAPTNGFLFTTSSPRQNERAGIANATADLDYNNTDLELGYKFRVGKSLGLRLFGGLKFAAINQTQVANYDQIDYTNGRIKIGNDFSGFGPRLGAEARILLGSGFSLFGRGAASLLIGDLTSTYRETDNDGADLVADLQRQTSQSVPVLEAAIGLDWQASLGKRTKLNLSAGYEYQRWFGTSDDLRFVNASNPGLFARSSGDLSLDGFFVKGGLSVEF